MQNTLAWLRAHVSDITEAQPDILVNGIQSG